MPVVADNTVEDPIIDYTTELFELGGLPYYMVIPGDPDRPIIFTPIVLTGPNGADTLIEYLEKGL